MLRYAIIFLVIALLASAFGMFGLSGVAMEAARILFFVFLVMLVISLFSGKRRGDRRLVGSVSGPSHDPPGRGRLAQLCGNGRSQSNRVRQRRRNMDATRKANREDNEITLQYTSPHEALLVEQASDDKLKQLLESVVQLEQTPEMAAAELVAE